MSGYGVLTLRAPRGDLLDQVEFGAPPVGTEELIEPLLVTRLPWHRYERRDRFDPDREVEQLCDMGAAEILLPEEEFRADLDRVGFGLAAVAPLRERYEASREAVIRRMVQLDQGPSVAVFLEYRLKPSEQAAVGQLSLIGPLAEPRRKLRIAYTVASDSFSAFLPRHKSIPETSCVYRAAIGNNVTTGIETWDIAELPSCRVEAMPMPPGDAVDASLRVVALLNLF
jgi:hypothetical protein